MGSLGISTQFSPANYSFSCLTSKIGCPRTCGIIHTLSLITTPILVPSLLSLCGFLRGGVQQGDLGGGSGAAIVSLGTLVFEKTATFKDTVDVS